MLSYSDLRHGLDFDIEIKKLWLSEVRDFS